MLYDSALVVRCLHFRPSGLSEFFITDILRLSLFKFLLNCLLLVLILQVPCLNSILAFAEGIYSNQSESSSDSSETPLSISLKMGQFISAADSTGQTALMLAARSGAASSVERLIAEHFRWSNILNETSTQELDATVAESVAKVLEQLSLGAHDSSRRSALHHACLASDDAPGLLILQG